MEDIETQKQKLVDLLYFYYKESKNEKVKINAITLQDANFGNLEQQGFLFNVICPSLKKEGVLKKFIPIPMSSFLADQRESLDFYKNIFKNDKERLERMQRILKQDEEVFFRSHDKGEPYRYYSFYFEVCSKKLEKIANKGCYSRVITDRLNFYPKDGSAEYRSAVWQFKGGTKGYEFLNFFNNNKNTIWRVEEIIRHCNDNINVEKHRFRTKKDIADTLREIRYRLKVKRGEFFPITKQKEGWIWIEK